MKDHYNRQDRILIVDDEPTNLRILMAALKDEDYEFTCATTGSECLKCATGDEKPDIILLDVIMQDMDGYEVCKTLKEDAATRDIPVIFITVMGEPGDESRGFQLGAVDYITKPFSSAIVKSRIRTHLELKRHRDYLEKMVRERTDNLSKRETELREQSMHLKEVNSALNVLLKKREKDKAELEDNIMANVKEFIIPYLTRLKKSNLNDHQVMTIKTLESNLENIISPFIQRLSSKFVNFTPMEIRVANLVKEGKTNKEIADLLCLSKHTILTHRHNLRTKLGLKHKKINLRTFLTTME